MRVGAMRERNQRITAKRKLNRRKMFIFGTYGFSDSNEYQLQRKKSLIFCLPTRTFKL